jgi:hypothetical protein
VIHIHILVVYKNVMNSLTVVLTASIPVAITENRMQNIEIKGAVLEEASMSVALH